MLMCIVMCKVTTGIAAIGLLGTFCRCNYEQERHSRLRMYCPSEHRPHLDDLDDHGAELYLWSHVWRRQSASLGARLTSELLETHRREGCPADRTSWLQKCVRWHNTNFHYTSVCNLKNALTSVNLTSFYSNINSDQVNLLLLTTLVYNVWYLISNY